MFDKCLYVFDCLLYFGYFRNLLFHLVGLFLKLMFSIAETSNCNIENTFQDIETNIIFKSKLKSNLPSMSASKENKTLDKEKKFFTEKISQPCPKCKSNSIYCTFSDNSHEYHIADWYFEFTHKCTRCGYEEYHCRTVCYDYETADDHVCPFCGKNWFFEVTRKP